MVHRHVNKPATRACPKQDKFRALFFWCYATLLVTNVSTQLIAPIFKGPAVQRI